MSTRLKILLCAVALVGVVMTIGLPITWPSKADRPEGGVGPRVAASAPGVDAGIISQGEEVEIPAHLEEGKLTLIEFTADW